MISTTPPWEGEAEELAAASSRNSRGNSWISVLRNNGLYRVVFRWEEGGTPLQYSFFETNSAQLRSMAFDILDATGGR